MKFISNFIIGILLSLSFGHSAFANPDINFIDSERRYNGAYLRHEIHGNRIRFVIEGNIADIQMPARLFITDNLRRFIRNYQNLTPALRQEFIEMLEQSMYSRHRAQPFLRRLIRVLDDYTAFRRNQNR